MKSAAPSKDANNAKKALSPVKKDKHIYNVLNRPKIKYNSLKKVLGDIKSNGGTPSVENMGTEFNDMGVVHRNSALLELQRTHGNQYVQKVAGIQAKLKIGEPGDVYEREADRIAEQVMRMPEPEIQRKCPGDKNCPLEDEEKKKIGLVQLKTDQSARGEISAPDDILSNIGPGQPLDAETRAFMEPRFGHDFSNVRVHRDHHSVESARAMDALAYTVGEDIVLTQGHDLSQTETGKKLLAHELMHVIQQTGFQSSDRVIQRACGKKAIDPITTDCNFISKSLGERRYLFNINCDEFASGEEERLKDDIKMLPAGTRISIIGASSSDGNFDFNLRLSCARMRAAENIIRSMPDAPTISSKNTVGPQGTPHDPKYRCVSLDFIYPGRILPVRSPPSPGYRRDPGGFFIPVLPIDPLSAYAACQIIPPITGAICGNAFTGLSCPALFCTPFPTIGIVRECRIKTAPILLAGISAAVRDVRVAPYWYMYLFGGTSSQINLTRTFGPDFAVHPISQNSANYLSSNLEAYLRRAAPTLFVGSGPWTIDFSSVLAPQIANLEVAGHPALMDFVPATTIPGLLAGGVGLTQAACAAGFIPSAFNDHRKAIVSATITKMPGGLVVEPQIDFRVEDTIDFCPGNCGSGLALAATILLSRLEASGISGDVPFLVDYTINPAPFII